MSTTNVGGKPASSSKPKEPLTTRLLRRAHSPTTASAIHLEKVKHKPLILHASHAPKQKPVLSTSITKSGTKGAGDKIKDARELRREARNAKLEAKGKRRRRKPQPLSAKEKRKRCFYDIPKEERNYEIFVGLNQLWRQYMREILGIEKVGSTERREGGSESHSGAATPDATLAGGKSESLKRKGPPEAKAARKRPCFTSQATGPLLVSADYHGAELEVVRSRSVSHVGLKGIVLRDTKFTFTIITRNSKIKVIPKELSILKFRVPLADEAQAEALNPAADSKSLQKGDGEVFEFEMHGDQFKNRAPDRASKKFKLHIPPDL